MILKSQPLPGLKVNGIFVFFFDWRKCGLKSGIFVNNAELNERLNEESDE